MRRRIYLDPESGPIDCTQRVSLWGFAPWDEKPEPEPALYDDALWDRYELAKRQLRAVENEIHDALVEEPLDEVEYRLGKEAGEIMYGDGDRNRERLNAIQDELLTNALTAVPKAVV